MSGMTSGKTKLNIRKPPQGHAGQPPGTEQAGAVHRRIATSGTVNANCGPKRFAVSRETLHAALEAIGDAITIQDRNLMVLWANQVALDRYGDIVGRKCHLVVQGRQEVCERCVVLETFADGKIRSHEVQGRSPEGDHVHFLVTASPIKDEAGEVIAVIEVFKDITQRKRAEEALRAANAHLKEEEDLLRDKNIALREILSQIEEQKQQIRHQIQSNVTKVILPVLEKLQARSGPMTKEYIEILTSSLKEITSPFIDKLDDRCSRLTPRDIETCNMIKSGMSSKEIAQVQNVSVYTVYNQRRRIRKKLNIADNKTNMASFLKTI